MAFWTIERRDDYVATTFRQGETVQDIGAVPHNEVDQLLGWMFLNPEGAQQYDRVDSPWFSGWVLEPNDNKN